MSRFHLAQFNQSRMLAPLDSPLLAGFAAELEPVNALADAAPGFVWRFQTETGDATGARVDDEPLLLVNLSVWEDLASLRAFLASPRHRAVYEQRREWFEEPDGALHALWWVPVGTGPSIEEGRDRLLRIRRHGPTPEAFSLQAPFDPPVGPRSSS